MSGIFMSDPRWTYEDPSGLPDVPAAAPLRGEIRVVREPRRFPDLLPNRRPAAALRGTS
jgi:hypothetical protein